MGKQRYKQRQAQATDVVPQETAEHAAEVEQSLTAIFRNEEGGMPDLSKLDRRRSNLIVWVFGGIAAFIVILITAIWLGFAVFKPFQGFKGQGLAMTIDGPEKVTLGQEMTYFINYQNISSDPLASAEIHVSFPLDFTVSKIEPAPTGDGLVWRLGSVPFSGRGTITIKGFFNGALGTTTAIQAVGTYRPASFNSDFEQLTTRSLEYAESVLDGLIDVPAKVLPGDRVRINYTLQNRGSNPLAQLEARITLPQGFVREASSTNAMDGSVARISVGTLQPGATSTVSIFGTFASGVSGDLLVHAEVGRVSVDGTFQAAQKTDATIPVLAGDLTINLVVNGSDADRSVGAGDPLRFTLAYQNTSPEEIKGIRLKAIFEQVSTASGTTAVPAGSKKQVTPKFIDMTQLDDSSSGTVNGTTITWDKSRIGELERFPSQTDGSIEFSVPVAAYASGTPDVPFQVSVEAYMDTVGTTKVARTVRTKPIVFHLRTDARLISEARYFSEEGAPFGTGPLPPVVGQTTTYRIHWEVDKTLHELGKIRVSAVLPQIVAWPNNANVTAGQIGYDQSSRTVTWTLNRLPADVNEADADFDVQLTPSVADAGRFADLVGETRFEATDNAISEPIVKTTPGLNTDLQNDAGAKSKGVVKKP